MGRLVFLLLAVFIMAGIAVLENRHGYPNPAHKQTLYEAKIKEITKKCDWGTEMMGDVFELPLMNFYPSTEHWKNYTGSRLIPEQSHSGHLFTKPFNKYPYVNQGIQGGRCDVPLPDGSTWTFDRVGPFKSTGNYDWWQFAWSNVLDFRDKLKDQPDGIYLLNTFSGAVDEQGELQNFPPIHVHHVHHTPGLGGMFTFNPSCQVGKALFGWHSEIDCWGDQRILDWIHEQHGDYGCKDEEGGLECLVENLAGGYAKLVKGPMSVDGEMNDVRVANSPEITWYAMMGARWIPNNKDLLARSSIEPKPRPISTCTIWSPGRTNLNDQSTMVHTFLAPTDRETIMWYTGKMWTSGTLIRGKTHTHNQIFQQMYMFTGPPENIGLTDRFRPEVPYQPVDTESLGFNSNEELRDYVLARYHETRAKKGNQASRIVCETNTSYDVIDGYFWDRRSNTGCTPWDFKEGEQFTVIGFNGVPPGFKSTGPHMPDTLAPSIPCHLGYFWLYDTHDGESHYTASFYTQDVEHWRTSKVLGDVRAMPQVLGMVYNGGTQSRHDFLRFVAVLCVVSVVALISVAWVGYAGIIRIKKVD